MTGVTEVKAKGQGIGFQVEGIRYENSWRRQIFAGRAVTAIEVGTEGRKGIYSLG